MYDVTKRCVDIIVSASCLIFMAPLFAFIAIVLRFTGERQVFYFQDRIGFRNQHFRMLKFATMVKNSLQLGTGSITVRNDPRVTKVGKFLRMTKINELPQLVNVFLGQMTLVGPRPFVDDTFAAYPEHVRLRVYNVKPGLTGIGSIVYRDEEAIISASDLSPAECYRQVIAPHKGELELWYQDHRSWHVDIMLLGLTLWTVVFPNGSRIVYRMFKGLPEPLAVDCALSTSASPFSA